MSDRLQRERQTIAAMIEIYCRGQHKSSDSARSLSSGEVRSDQQLTRVFVLLCPECSQLLDYAMGRIARCPFKADKPTCAKCPIHCYKPAMRQQIRQVMLYAGPRMVFHHPLLTTMHYWDELVKKKSTPGE